MNKYFKKWNGLLVIFYFTLPLLAFTQSRQVTGIIKASDDQSFLPGVTVSEKGTSNGAVTDIDGKYTIVLSSINSTIVFSLLGYEDVEVVVNDQNEINLSLIPSSEQINEVLVLGYSEKKKSEITGSVINLTSEKIKGVTGSNIEYMLQGKAAGVQVSSASGAPGAVAEIRIRGNSSINADRGPLVVVDGIIGGNYNPNDVESITVLKDAGAIALYGSRANSGVLVVTTKRGKNQKPQISYKSTVGQRQITTGNFHLMNSAELYDTERAMFASSAQFNVLRPASVKDINTDWLNLAYDKGIIQSHNVSASGKSGKINYYLAGVYYNENGTLLSTKYNRYNFRSNVDYEFSDKVKLSTSINLNQDNTNSYHWRWPYQPFLYLPYDSPFDQSGNIKYVDANNNKFLTRDKNNIHHSAVYNDYTSGGFNLNADFTLSVALTSHVKFQSRNRYGFSTYKSKSYEDARTIEGKANNGALGFGQSEGLSLISTNLLKFSNDYGAHHFSAFVGFEGQKYNSEDAGANGYGIVSGIKIPGGIAVPQSISGGKLETKAMSILSEVSYDYHEKYFASLSYRRDGSSLFGANKRWGNFGAISASWLINKEAFFTNKSINLFKLRGSYGIIGNDNIPAFQYLAKYNFTTQYNGGSAGYPETLPNPDLGWEQTKSADVGIDVSIKNRIHITADAFFKNTDDLLLKVQLPPSQGIAEVWKNSGRIFIKGAELDVNADIIQKDKIKWNIGFNAGTAQNEVKALANGTTAINKDYDGVKQSIQVGHDINSWYLPKWIGVDPANGNPLWEAAVVDAQGQTTGFKITNEYAAASATSSLQLVGSATPKLFGGFNSSVDYHQFSLTISTAYQYGNMVYHRTREFIDADGANFNFNLMRLPSGWSRWQNKGDITTHPKPVFGGNLQSNKPSSRFLEDGSYWRLRNVRLGYNLPTNIASKMKLSSTTIFISGDNLYTLTKFSGLDPEVPSFGVAGLSDFKYPISKQYLMGLQINF
jgi:TonB-linked SusC/RagA family outer membrane protein